MTSLNIDRAADNAVYGLVIHGGATVNVKAAPDPKSGYVVADGEHERTILFRRLDGSLLLDGLRDLIVAYVEQHKAWLAVPGNFLGAWLDGDHLVLDVVNVHPERAVAERLGRERNQRAIFHLDTGETITL